MAQPEKHLLLAPRAIVVLGLFGAAGVGVSFMEPRLFWFGAVICLCAAVATISLYWSDTKTLLIKRRKVRRKPVKIPRELLLAFGMICFCIGAPILLYFTRSEPILNYGTLSTSWYETVLSFVTKQPKPTIEVGGAKFVWGGPEGKPIFTFARDSHLTIERIHGSTKISTRIRDRSGKIVAELYRNEWKVASPPRAWDRNYSNDAIEVINQDGFVVLQVKVLPDRVQLQGEWWDASGKGVRIMKYKSGGGALMVPLPKPETPDILIEPIFKYPSEFHLGELKK